MNIEQLTTELGEWNRDMRVTVDGDGDILRLEPDGHGGLLLVCGDTDEPGGHDRHFYEEVEQG